MVAERLAGTEAQCAQDMTDTARAMGMSRTTFKNASGLPDTKQVSTARDMAILAERLLSDHADYYGYFANKRFAWGKAHYNNHHIQIGRIEGVDGIKTGYTRASGFNLMASAKRNGRRVIAIMFGGTTSRSRDSHVAELIEAAYTSMTSDKAGPPDAAALTFSQIQTPVDPNGAALPVLNGKVFTPSMVQIAEGDEGSKAE